MEYSIRTEIEELCKFTLKLSSITVTTMLDFLSNIVVIKSFILILK